MAYLSQVFNYRFVSIRKKCLKIDSGFKEDSLSKLKPKRVYWHAEASYLVRKDNLAKQATHAV